ncbi:MAG: class I SAM-dependent methyltransferase [Proteobacteria bacterium]|nr:class I SAM-dependent methyltransferase [Pseudomonadota bacterium]
MNTIYCLCKTEYYAPFPLLKVNDKWEIGDVNLSCQILFDSFSNEDFVSSIRQHLNELHLKWIANNLDLSDKGFKNAFYDKAITHIDSMEFGDIVFKLTVIGLPDPDSINSLERTAFIELDNVKLVDAFLAIYQRQLQHQLIWETYAVSYDVVLHEMDYYAEVVNRHHSALSAEGVERVIDIGAGTGNVTIPLLQAGRSVTAIDMSRAMLDKMHFKLRALDKPAIKIFQQSAEDLSAFADGSFDGVNILLALFDMGNPAAALNEAIRVLRPGGALIITEPKRTFNLPSLLSHAEQSLQGKGLYDKLSVHWKCVTGVNKQINPSTRTTRLYIEDIEEKLMRAGFNITDFKDSHYGNCATLRANKPV